MLGLAPLRFCAVNLAPWVDEPSRGTGLLRRIAVRLEGIQTGAAGITLVTTGTKVMADGAFALDETVGKELVVCLDGAEWLASLSLFNVAIFPEVGEDFLNDARVVLGRRAVEDIKV